MELIKTPIESMPRGTISEIVEKSGVSRPTVYKVLQNIDNYEGDIDVYNKVIAAATVALKKRAESIKKGSDSFSKALQGCKI